MDHNNALGAIAQNLGYVHKATLNNGLKVFFGKHRTEFIETKRGFLTLKEYNDTWEGRRRVPGLRQKCFLPCSIQSDRKCKDCGTIVEKPFHMDDQPPYFFEHNFNE